MKREKKREKKMVSFRNTGEIVRKKNGLVQFFFIHCIQFTVSSANPTENGFVEKMSMQNIRLHREISLAGISV